MACCASLAGCDLETLLADPKELQKTADARAIGGSCRQGLRAIEDCYALNPKASKAAIYAGWKEMDLYMRENKLEGEVPKGPSALNDPPPPPAPAASAASSKPARAAKASASAAKGAASAPQTPASTAPAASRPVAPAGAGSAPGRSA